MILVLRSLALGKTFPRLPGVTSLLATNYVMGSKSSEALLVGGR